MASETPSRLAPTDSSDAIADDLDKIEPLSEGARDAPLTR
jgi:hypothetical protein